LIHFCCGIQEGLGRIIHVILGKCKPKLLKF